MGMMPVETGGTMQPGAWTMRIVLKDGRLFEGTPLEICRAMQATGLGTSSSDPLRPYLEGVADTMLRLAGVELDLGEPTDTDEELASRFIYEAIEGGLALLVH